MCERDICVCICALTLIPILYAYELKPGTYSTGIYRHGREAVVCDVIFKTYKFYNPIV